MCDGLNPFAKEKVSYSMWPIMMFPLNLPSSIHKLSSTLMPAGIIPGPKEPKNIDPYIEVVVDDILNLNDIQVYDALDKAMFKVQSNIILYVFDYPGQSKVLHSQGKYCTYRHKLP